MRQRHFTRQPTDGALIGKGQAFDIQLDEKVHIRLLIGIPARARAEQGVPRRYPWKGLGDPPPKVLQGRETDPSA